MSTSTIEVFPVDISLNTFSEDKILEDSKKQKGLFNSVSQCWLYQTTLITDKDV